MVEMEGVRMFSNFEAIGCQRIEWFGGISRPPPVHPKQNDDSLNLYLLTVWGTDGCGQECTGRVTLSVKR